ncbi:MULTISPECIES: hypothetical protein [Oleiagrimonas]|uniref:Tetratricopeptide repeat protein n=1 Tax=Oleiagrimonas citrea TaxID=1665687 RepID=A0A846ZPC9_9GAMM|nr:MULTISPECIES: hypothetical protein [Oleiagrimonas]NKZ40074.1 hypothetical protein [Oleiagrimonas citrea]
MKLVSFSKVLLAGAVAFMMVGGTAIAHGSQSASEKQQSKYPNSVRKAPKLDLKKQDDADTINKASKAYNTGDYATAQKLLQPYVDGTATDSKYAQVVALQIMANVTFKQGDVKKAIDMLKKALALNVMPNDTYFDLQYELAQFYHADKQFQQSVDTVEKWRAGGKLETADSYGLEGIDYYQMGQYEKAIASIKKAMSMTDKPKDVWNQVLAASYAETGNSDEALASARAQLAKHPDDMTTLNNTVSLLITADKYEEAMKLLEQANSKGLFTESKSYITLAKLHLMKAQDSDNPKPEAKAAVDVIKEGIAKGVVKPGYQAYKVEGDAAYLSDDIKGALTAYEKASKDAPNGEIDLISAKLLLSERKYSAARLKARGAVKRGLKHEGEAYMVIAESERAMHNKSAAIKAMKKAEQDPTTRAKAQAWLKKASR